jgi:hypothetical protein
MDAARRMGVIEDWLAERESDTLSPATVRRYSLMCRFIHIPWAFLHIPVFYHPPLFGTIQLIC